MSNARKYDAEYWKKDTHNAWWLPFPQKNHSRGLSAVGDKGLTLNKCKECDNVYEHRWIVGKGKYYKMWVYSEMPKLQKKVNVCPKCKGKKVHITEM